MAMLATRYAETFPVTIDSESHRPCVSVALALVADMVSQSQSKIASTTPTLGRCGAHVCNTITLKDIENITATSIKDGTVARQIYELVLKRGCKANPIPTDTSDIVKNCTNAVISSNLLDIAAVAHGHYLIEDYQAFLGAHGSAHADIFKRVLVEHWNTLYRLIVSQ